MNKLQKSKTLSLGRIATLSAIKENLRVKTAFQKNELPQPSPNVLLDRHSNSSFVSYGGDTDSPPLLFSAISSYKPEKIPRQIDAGCDEHSPHESKSNSSSSPRGEPPLSSFGRRPGGQPSSPLVVSIPDDQQVSGSSCDAEFGSKQRSRLHISNHNGSETLQPVVKEDEEINREGHSGFQLREIRAEILSSSKEVEGEDEEYWSIPPKVSGLAIDRRDLSTGDKWIPRHPDLVRVQGFHPFNAETPLTTLMHFGFLTPTSLHFVRNHNPVPHAVWDSWSIEVTGLVRNPKKLSMRDLLLFPSRRLPVTLACSGNRGKELNRIGHVATEGLNWGPGALGTSVWGGARLCDVLRHCGVLVHAKRKQSHFVKLVGADSNRSGAVKCGYETSIPLEDAMDESRDVLLAYEQNMDLLTPDHGFPVRLVVPGFAGGRSVKWLTKIEICATDSDSYYHVHENRMLPSQVEDLHTAVSQGWMGRPEFLINDMNVNSIISWPAHNSNILSAGHSNPMTEYPLKGYAYSGSGKKVIRVELSLDGGKSWKQCTIEYFEQPTKYGKHWCWCFWELVVQLEELSTTAEIVVRAWDSAMNTQPELYSWNILGVMNNSWYRVKIQQDPTVEEDEPPTMTFEHPVQPGNIPGGWLQEPTGLGHELVSRLSSVKYRHSESSSSLDIGENSPRTPRPWRI